MVSNKIVSLEDMADIADGLHKNKRIIVECHGVFDLLHPGHFKHLEVAKKYGDVLVVTLTTDRYVNKGPDRPVFNARLRAESIAKDEDVNYVVISEYPTAVECVTAIKPNIFVKGGDYAEAAKDPTRGMSLEKETVEKFGGKLVFTDEIVFSSTNILNRYFDLYPKEVTDYLDKFRAKYSVDEIISVIDKLKSKKVLIVGDTILDRYCYCSSMNKTPKENLIPVKYINEETFTGGVLATANHIANFCDSVTLVTCLGKQNDYESFIKGNLNKHITPVFYYRDDAPTIIKQRYIESSFFAKLFEVAYMNDSFITDKLAEEVMRYIDMNWCYNDAVIVNDFGHGFITNDMSKELSRIADNKFTSLNVQTNSANTGYNLVNKYAKASYVCIDSPEARLASRNRYGTIEEVIKQLTKEMKCPNFTVTHSRYETITYNAKQGFFKTPVFSSRVVDTMGAGDAVFAITSLLVADNVPADIVGFIGNLVGALKVGIIGNKASVEKAPLYKFLGTLLK